jgi:diacylglycerol kinase family enzyme
VVVAGGDGTLNEAANGLAGTSTAMGILPCGTANVLARELGIPRDLPRAWTLANGAPARPVDLVRAEYRGREGRPCARRFVQVAGVGLDALLVRNVEGGASKARWGRLGYALELLRSWRTPLPRITLEIDGSERLEGAFALFGNGRLYAGPFEVFHGAAMDDGFLDVRLFLSRSPRHLFACVRDMLLGVPQDPARVLSRRTREVSVEAPSPVPLELDGEYVGEMPGRLRVEPLALKVQAPEPDGEGRTARPPPGA